MLPYKPHFVRHNDMLVGAIINRPLYKPYP